MSHTNKTLVALGITLGLLAVAIVVSDAGSGTLLITSVLLGIAGICGLVYYLARTILRAVDANGRKLDRLEALMYVPKRSPSSLRRVR